MLIGSDAPTDDMRPPSQLKPRHASSAYSAGTSGTIRHLTQRDRFRMHRRTLPPIWSAAGS